MAGTFMAKSIVDGRLMDMPVSPVMWDLIFGKVSFPNCSHCFVFSKVTLFSLKPLGDIYGWFEELQLVANRIEEINSQ